MEQVAFTEAVVSHIKQMEKDAGRDVSQVVIEPDTNLFDLGVVTSFSIIRLILFIEELTGTAIDLSNEELDQFYTLGGLYLMIRPGGVR